MPAPRLIYDGLWRCLCPAFDSIALSRAIGAPLPRPRPRRCSPLRAARFQHAAAAARPQKPLDVPRVDCTGLASVEAENPPAPPRPAEHNAQGTGNVQEIVAQVAGQSTSEISRVLGGCPDNVVDGVLLRLGEMPDGYDVVTAVVRDLLVRQQVRPREGIYAALAQVLSDFKGSATSLHHLLADAKILGFDHDPSLLRLCLRALAVHPSYLLRNGVLKTMRDQWVEMSLEDRQLLALGMLREGQHELALEALDTCLEMNTESSVPCLDVFILVLAGEPQGVEESLDLLKKRLNINPTGLPDSFLLYLLDRFSCEYFYEGTRHIWNHSATNGHLHVPDGVLINVLNTASRHKDSSLANEALQTMSARGYRLALPQYEAFVDSLADQGELADAFSAVCIMNEAGVTPTRGSTRRIFRLLRQKPELQEQAHSILHKLALGPRVPTSLGNVLVEAAAVSSGNEAALRAYRALQKHCRDGPDIDTFLPLVHSATEENVLLSLARDFVAARIDDPDPRHDFYQKLYQVCLKNMSLDNLEMALGVLSCYLGALEGQDARGRVAGSAGKNLLQMVSSFREATTNAAFDEVSSQWGSRRKRKQMEEVFSRAARLEVAIRKLADFASTDDQSVRVPDALDQTKGEDSATGR